MMTGTASRPPDVADDAAHATCFPPSFARRSFAQPGFTTCRARPRARASAGTSSRDGAARRHEGSVAHGDGRDQGHVAPHEGPGPDAGEVLLAPRRSCR